MQTAELSRESRDLGTFLRLSFEPFMTCGKSQCFYSLPLSLGGLTRPSHRTNFLHSAGQARKGPRGAIGPKQGHGPQKGPARCAAVSQRQAAHGGHCHLGRRSSWRNEGRDRARAPSPGTRARVRVSSRRCLAVFSRLILASRTHSKNLNPLLKTALIAIRLHKHHSIFIMFGAVF